MTIREQMLQTARVIEQFLTSMAETVIPAPYELTRVIDGDYYDAGRIAAMSKQLVANLSADDVVIEPRVKTMAAAAAAIPRFDEYGANETRDSFVSPADVIEPDEALYNTKPFTEITDEALERAEERDEREIQHF